MGTNYNYERYLQHLKSTYWQEVKRALFKKQNGLCPVCQTTLYGTKSEGHHRSYSALYKELDDLETCELLHPDCHDIRHNRTSPSLQDLYNKIKNWNPKI